MKLVNGSNKAISFNLETIKKEASQSGSTAIVVATCDDDTEITISQHGSGTWDISVNEEPTEEYYQHESTDAVKHFMNLVRQHNGAAK